VKDNAREAHRQRHPNGAPDPRFSIPDCVSFAIEEAQIEGQHGQNEQTEPNPEPVVAADCFHVGESK
jgi:hypothetical protein